MTQKPPASKHPAELRSARKLRPSSTIHPNLVSPILNYCFYTGLMISQKPALQGVSKISAASTSSSASQPRHPDNAATTIHLPFLDEDEHSQRRDQLLELGIKVRDFAYEPGGLDEAAPPYKPLPHWVNRPLMREHDSPYVMRGHPLEYRPPLSAPIPRPPQKSFEHFPLSQPTTSAEIERVAETSRWRSTIFNTLKYAVSSIVPSRLMRSLSKEGSSPPEQSQSLSQSQHSSFDFSQSQPQPDLVMGLSSQESDYPYVDTPLATPQGSMHWQDEIANDDIDIHMEPEMQDMPASQPNYSSLGFNSTRRNLSDYPQPPDLDDLYQPLSRATSPATSIATEHSRQQLMPSEAITSSKKRACEDELDLSVQPTKRLRREPRFQQLNPKKRHASEEPQTTELSPHKRRRQETPQPSENPETQRYSLRIRSSPSPRGVVATPKRRGHRRSDAVSPGRNVVLPSLNEQLEPIPEGMTSHPTGRVLRSSKKKT